LPERGHLPGWLTVGEWITHARRLYPDWSEASERRLIGDLAIRLDRPISHRSRGEGMHAAACRFPWVVVYYTL